MFLILAMKNWLASMDKSAYVRDVRVSILCQRTQQESCLPVCQLVSIQILAVAVDSTVAHELASTPLSYGLRVPGKHYLRQLPMNERAFVPEEFHYTTGIQKYKLVCIRED